MTDIFISYARSTSPQAEAVAEALRALGYGVWRDDELPAHRAYAEVIDERLAAAKAVVVIWSAEAVKSEWVQSEADTARTDRKLVQITIDGSKLPRPFDRIQCADLAGWSGDTDAPGWRKVVGSVAELMGGSSAGAAPTEPAPLPLPSKPSIAVMPFANLSGDPEQDYFADGMVAEITTALSRYRSIFVIGSGSTLSFKGKAVSPQEVGRQLGVRYVLEGSVRKAGNRVRITVQLLDAADGVQIWADRFEDTLDDIFALQDRVALSAAGVIEPRVKDAETRRAIKRPTENMSSYDLYLRASALGLTMQLDNMSLALDLLHRAIDQDPKFGTALGLAAIYHAGRSFIQGGDPAELGVAGALVDRALEAAADDPYVVAVIVSPSVMLGRDLAPIAAMVERALALNPGLASLWSASARLHLALGETDLAILHSETALRLDPLTVGRFIILSDLGCARFLQGRHDEAVVLFRQSIGLRPAFYFNHLMLASVLGRMGRAEEAREALARFRALTASTIQDTVQRRVRSSEAQKLIFDGIALAEGTAPSENHG